MKRLYQKSVVCVYLILLVTAWNPAAFGRNSGDVIFDQKSKDRIINAVLKKELALMPQLNKLIFGFGRYRGIDYYYEKTVSRIFFQDEILTAKVIDVSIEGLQIALTLSHPVFGTGTVKFSFSENLLKQTTDEDIQKILLESLGDENHQYVFLDPAGGLYHLWSCNHFSNPSQQPRMKREDADQKGYRPSGFCFKKVLYLPDLSVEKAIEAEWSMRLSSYESVETESERQIHLSAVGEKVLRNWPLKLLGYDYTFRLAKSSEINAFPIPTGKIIITTALLDSLDNDNELEALLAYAIAHIEQRHSLKKYYSCMEDEAYSDAMKKLATVAGVLAGPAGGGISGALSLAIPEESCNPQSLIGFPNNYIQQADSMVALYFDVHGITRKGIVSLIKKLQFSELAVKLHPDLSLPNPQDLPDPTRIERVQNIKFKYFRKGNVFELKRNGKPPLQLKLEYHQIFKDENRVLIYLDDKALLPLALIKKDKATVQLSITDKVGVHTFKLEKDLMTEDVWSAFLIFSDLNGNTKTFLQDAEKIILTVYPVRGPNDKLSDQPLEKYRFVPGAVES